jgi:hypothetical protein
MLTPGCDDGAWEVDQNSSVPLDQISAADRSGFPFLAAALGLGWQAHRSLLFFLRRDGNGSDRR